MSFSLFWRPAPKDIPPGEYLDDALKHALGRRLWDSGSSRSDKTEIGKEIIPYLEGLADGGVAGATELIEAIRANGAVEVWIGDSERAIESIPLES